MAVSLDAALLLALTPAEVEAVAALLTRTDVFLMLLLPAHFFLMDFVLCRILRRPLGAWNQPLLVSLFLDSRGFVDDVLVLGFLLVESSTLARHGSSVRTRRLAQAIGNDLLLL